MGFCKNAGMAGVAIVLVAAGGLVSNARAAESRHAAYQGAWLVDGVPCEEIFSSTGKGASFKKPVNAFAPGFIIVGSRIRTPMASCSIRSTKRSGERETLMLDCANSVSVGDTSTILSRSPDGTLKRYFNDEDKTGTAYRLCHN